MSIARTITRTAPLALLSVATLTAGAADIVFNAGTATPTRARAMLDFKSANPRADFSTHQDGRIGRVYGRAFSQGVTAAQSVQSFVSQHADMWGVDAAELIPEGPFEDRRHTMPVMYQPETDTYKFTATYFTQTRNGLPVYGSKLVLLTRNEANNPLVLASSQLFDLSAFNADPVIARAAANHNNLLEIANDQFNGAIQIWSTDRVIYAGNEANPHEPVVADVTILDIDGYEKIEMITDAATGEILHADSIICTVDATGNVSGMASDGPAADICEDEIAMPLPYLNVNLQGGGSAITDVDGNYTIPNGGSGNVTIDAELDGQWFNINNYLGSGTAESITADPSNPINILFNSLNNSEQVRSEVNVYVESNRVRDWVLEANPSYPLVAGTEMEVWVNRTDGFCPGNAWYDPGIDTINFCLSGSSNPNTGWSSVVHHEYGHHLVSAGGSGQGQYGEGTGDVMSVIILDDPDLGIGFFGSCGSALRTAVNNLTYPCATDGHACAPLYSGAVWGTRNLLAITEPDDYQKLLMSWALNSILVHSGTLITPQMTIDYLTLDDDDADIGNGTPHYFEIDGGFGAKNMPAPPLNLINIEPVAFPDFANPAGGTTISAEFTNVTGEFDPSTATLMVDTGSGFQAIPMSNAGGNNYEANLPSSDCGTQILFYIAGTSTSGITQTSPSDAPASTYSIISATSAPVVAFDDDFESNQGWSVSGDAPNSASGRWERVIPTGNAQRGDPGSDYDGSSRCYVTGNGTPGENTDVDGGDTILTSPTMDATGAAFVSYARWYSNTFGASPNADTFVVEVSDDNGSTWSNLETVGPGGDQADGGWYEVEYALSDVPGFTANDQFRIRFIASDFGDGSVVEAGVDAVSLSVASCDATCTADLNGDGNLDFFDVSDFLSAYNAMDPSADFNGDGSFNFFDVSAFLNAFNAGCP
tara:strand:- start:509 stop:3307 length:2799 start_codon:yes stop_codon:yes gene_type:complete